MTQDGLANLFGDVVEIKKKSVPQWGHPLHSLAWFLSDYHRFLPSETAANFQKLTVQELIQMRFNRSHPIFAELSEEGRRVLATSTLIVAVKR